MFELHSETIERGVVLKYCLLLDGVPLEYGQVLRFWQEREDFRRFFSDFLAEVPFSAYRWETPGLTLQTLQRPFECVVINSPALDRPSDLKSFKDYISRPESGISIENQSRDAILVIPTLKTSAQEYAHLAAFLRSTSQQKYEIWTQLSYAMTERLRHKKVYLSTAGAGVAWLHFRLDDRPKYYAFQNYRKS